MSVPGASSQLPKTLQESVTQVAKVAYQRIATEEAWCPQQMLDMYRDLVSASRLEDPGFNTMFEFYLNSQSERASWIRRHLVDLGELRIAHMDQRGIAKQILSLTAPGVQVFDKGTAVTVAREWNDLLSDAINRHPERFAGLAAIAPQDPPAAASELQRCVQSLGLKGAIVNSHTFGEYLDDPKFWPIFEAAESLDVPIYLHPRTSPPSMIGPLLECGLDGAIFGFAVDTGMHLLRIMTSGAFDRYPRLKLVVGHLGEGLPFWLYRLDYMHRAGVGSRRYKRMQATQLKLSDYMRRNVYVTTSGMPWAPAIQFCQKVLGESHVLYAMDYPYEHELEEVVACDDMPIDEGSHARFFQNNAEELFRL